MGGAPGGAAGGKADAEEQKKAMEEMRQNMVGILELYYYWL